MAVKHVVTLGFGFADGVAFIPTLGFTPGAAVVQEEPPIYDCTLDFDYRKDMTLDFDHALNFTVDFG